MFVNDSSCFAMGQRGMTSHGIASHHLTWHDMASHRLARNDGTYLNWESKFTRFENALAEIGFTSTHILFQIEFLYKFGN